MNFQKFSTNKITPLVPGNILLRDRLFSLFDQLQTTSSFWISGPGGSGKSTLITSYLAQRNLPCIWYQIDVLDDDLSNFFYYLSLAAEPFVDSEELTLPLLTPEYLLNVDTYITRYFEALFQCLKTPCWLIFDNFQDASDDSPVRQVLLKVISMLPQNINIAIVSRNDPPPTMTKFFANRIMTRITAEQIAFTQNEFRELISLSRCQLSVEETEKIFQITHGWVAGIILWLLHSENHTPSRPLPAGTTPESIFDYFASEILEKVDPSVRQFLLKTALLPNMTIEMASQLSGLAAKAILNELNRKNFFLEKRNLPIASYQYHPLFRDFLLAKAKTIFSAADLNKLCNLAAEILINNDLIEDGITLYLRAKSYEPVVGIILSHAPVLASQGRHKVLTSWIDCVPPEYSLQNPWLLFWKGIGLIPGQPLKGHALCIQAYEVFLEINDLSGQIISWSMIVETYLLLRGTFTPIDHWIYEGERLGKLLADNVDINSRARFASSMLIALLLRKPEHFDISYWQDQCEEFLEQCVDEQIILSLASNLSLSYQWLGQSAKARWMLAVLRPLADSDKVSPIIRIGSSAMISGLLLATGDWDGCRQYANDGLAIGKETGIHIYDFLLLCSEVYLRLLTGELDLAVRTLEEMKEVRMAHATWDNGHYHFLIAWLYMQKGELDKAKIFIDKCIKITNSCGNPFTIARSVLLKTQILLENSELHNAKVVLRRLTGGEVEHSSKHIDFTINLVLADFSFCENKMIEGRNYLTKAFSEVEQSGIIIPAGLNHSRLSTLCLEALAADIKTDTVIEFIRLVRLSPPSARTVSERWPWPVQIYTLGCFEITRYGEAQNFSTRTPKKPLELLKLLICTLRHKSTREFISDRLWPDVDGDRAVQSFNITLHRLRKIIGLDEAIIMEKGRLFLNPDLCWVDSWYFEELVQQALVASDFREMLMRKALSLYIGSFGIDHGNNLEITGYSEQLKNKWIALVGHLVMELVNTNLEEQALDLLYRSLALDNNVEEFYQAEVTIFLAQGRTNEAIAAFKRCSTVLARSGMVPSDKTITLCGSLL